MMESVGRMWSRDAVGYRRGELEDGDGLAAVVVVSIGGPAVIVGATLTGEGGLSMIQLLLLAPLAALGGGLLVGASARMAASTGATGTWLLRPAFGLVGSWLISLLRLLMVCAWGVIGLQFASRWADAALASGGVELGAPWITGVILAVVALGAVVVGPLATVHRIIRRPLFWLSVLLLAFVAWRLALAGTVAAGSATGSFWPAAQVAIEMAAVFVPYAQVIGRRLKNDDDAFSTFGVGYTVATTLVLVTGAIFAQRLSGLSDLTGIDVGTVGVFVAVAWVLIAELDQIFATFVAAGAEATGVVGRVAPVVVGTVTAIGVVAAASLMSPLSQSWALLLTSLVFPACLVAVADFFLARDSHYSESEIYGAAAGDALLNVVGVVTWLLAVILGQALDPVGPARWTEIMPTPLQSTDLPWRVVMAVAAAIAYVVLIRWRRHRADAVYDLRGV